MPKLLEHMGNHILFDPELRNASPCGLCLSANGRCYISITRKSRGIKAAESIDMANSRCLLLTKVFRLSDAITSTASSPCSNAPVHCPCCAKGTRAVWRYNLEQHLKQQHPECSITLYRAHYEITDDEVKWMKERPIPQAPRQSKKQKAPQPRKLRISEAHSTRLALR